MPNFKERLSVIVERVEQACVQAGRPPEKVDILPVTKNHGIQAVLQAAAAGFKAVGENRIQEALEKQAQLKKQARIEEQSECVPECVPPLDGKPICKNHGSPEHFSEHTSPIQWEFIGHLQSNKARVAAQHFSRVQSVDSVKILQALEKGAAGCDKKLGILLQINTAEDPAKFGADRTQAAALLERALQCPHLRPEGLMTIAEQTKDRKKLRAAFGKLRSLRDELQAQFRCPLPELSMGMSHDLEAAILEGSTQLRIGTALFGERSSKHPA